MIDKIEQENTIPNGWALANFSEVANFCNGINFKKSQKGSKGIPTVDVLNMYPQGIFLKTSNLYRVDTNVNDERILKFGDILFVRSSVKREGVGWTIAFRDSNEPITFCGFIIRARIKDLNFSPEYLTYYFRCNKIRELLISKGSQVTITNISQSTLSRLPVPTPIKQLGPKIDRFRSRRYC